VRKAEKSNNILCGTAMANLSKCVPKCKKPFLYGMPNFWSYGIGLHFYITRLIVMA
jgi:hypothetical protein